MSTITRSARRGALVLLAPGLVIVSLAGCSSTKQAAAPAGDPLLGSSAAAAIPKAPGAPTPVAQATPTSQPKQPVAPLPPPPPTALTSNAALAGTVPSRPFDPSSDLRIPGRPDAYGIGAPPGTAPAPTFNAPTPRPTTYTPPYQPPPPPPANNTGVVLSQPIAVPPAATPTSNRTPTPETHAPATHAPTHTDSHAPPSAGQPFSYEEAQRQLKQRGVVWQRLETWGDKGEWKFACSVPNPQNAFISRNYEAKAANYLEAMRLVLEQMSRDHR